VDEQRLGELFRAAAGDTPPATFDERDIATKSRQVTQRRRSLIAGGGGLAVVVLAVGLLLGTGVFGHTLGRGPASSAAGALAPEHTATGGHTFAPALGAPNVVGPRGSSFPPTAPMQGGAPGGEAGHGAGSTHAGCGPTDRELAVALAGELPSVGAPVAGPATLTCPPGSRTAAYLVPDGSTTGYVIAVLAPRSATGQVRDTASGSLAYDIPSRSGRWTLYVVSQPTGGRAAGPLAARLAGYGQSLAAMF
jgi:hypothetical protein